MFNVNVNEREFTGSFAIALSLVFERGNEITELNFYNNQTAKEFVYKNSTLDFTFILENNR